MDKTLIFEIIKDIDPYNQIEENLVSQEAKKKNDNDLFEGFESKNQI